MTAVPAWHYDGETGVRRNVTVSGRDDGFDLVEGGAATTSHRWTDLVTRPARGGCRVFGLKDQAGWQIGLPTDLPADFAAHLPKPVRYGRWIDRIGLLPATALALVVSISALGGAMTGSEWLAQRLPSGWEQRLGRNMAGQFAARQCRNAQSEAALTALAQRLSPPGLTTHIQVVRQQDVNAVAMPGGEIVIFDGLLRQAKSADELAGVLAHEIGHVAHRDTSQSLVRQIALKLVLGGMGGDSGNGLSAVMSANHSREAEEKADAYAIEVLRRARISPADTAALFARLQKDEAERAGGPPSAMAAFLASHPVSDGRRALFSASFDRATAYRPALDREQWENLADICVNDQAGLPSD